MKSTKWVRRRKVRIELYSQRGNGGWHKTIKLSRQSYLDMIRLCISRNMNFEELILYLLTYGVVK